MSQNPVLGPKNRVLTEPFKKPGWPQNRVFGPKNRVWGQTRAPSPACCGTLGGIRQLPAAWGAFYVLALITDNGPSETRVVRRSQARGRRAGWQANHTPTTTRERKQTDRRQTDRTGSNPHTDQTPQRESPPPKDTPWCPRYYPYRPTHQGDAFVRCPPIRHLVVRVRVRVRPLCPPKRPHGPGKHQPGLQCAQT